MNRLTTGSAVLIAALAAGHAEPVSAKGLSKEVRALIKQEVAKQVSKIPRVRGPRGEDGRPGSAGPAGPAGMDGFPFMYAHIHGQQRTVDESRSLGITQENLVVEERLFEGAESPHPDGNPMLQVTYCFTGLPPVTGGQVTSDGDGAGVASPKLWLNPDDGSGCPVRVVVYASAQYPDQDGSDQFPDSQEVWTVEDNFYLLLY